LNLYNSGFDKEEKGIGKPGKLIAEAVLFFQDKILSMFHSEDAEARCGEPGRRKPLVRY
jgi:hypothetical protein